MGINEISGVIDNVNQISALSPRPWKSSLQLREKSLTTFLRLLEECKK